MSYWNEVYNTIDNAKTYDSLANTPIPDQGFIDKFIYGKGGGSVSELAKYRDAKLTQLRDAEFAPILNQYKSAVDFAKKEDPNAISTLIANLPEMLDNHPIAAKFKGATGTKGQGYDSYLDIMRNYAATAQKQAQVDDALKAYDAGTDTADHRVVLTQHYGKDVDNVLKPHAERKAYNQDMNFLDEYARMEPQKYNNLSESTAAFVQAARKAGKALKPEDVDKFRDSTRHYWESIKDGKPYDSTTTNGPVSETTTLQDYALGKPSSLGSARQDKNATTTANATAKQAEIAARQLEAEERRSADEKINHTLAANTNLSNTLRELDPKLDKEEYDKVQKQIDDNNANVTEWEKARSAYGGDKKGKRPTATAKHGKIVRTGVDKSGRKVVQYKDGTIDYAK